MVAIPEPEISTVKLIYDKYEADEEAKSLDIANARGHLGASYIGQECHKRIWLSFRWSSHVKHKGRMLRLFKRGNREEEWFVDDLRSIGVKVAEVDPATGRQWEVRDSTGHFGGSMDGIGVGFVEAPKTEHVLEFKTHNDKSFKALCKDRVQLSKPQHYAQMQSYMHLKKINRAFYLAVNKNDDSLYQERVYYDAEYAMRLVAKAQAIINSPNPPERISAKNDPTWFECKLCEHNAVCYGEAAPARHCRSCVSSTPIEDGKWHCAKHDKILSLTDQKIGCNSHRYIPKLLPAAEALDAGEDWAWVEYRLPDGTIWRDEGP